MKFKSWVAAYIIVQLVLEFLRYHSLKIRVPVVIKFVWVSSSCDGHSDKRGEMLYIQAVWKDL